MEPDLKPAVGPSRMDGRHWTMLVIILALLLQGWMRTTRWRGVLVSTVGETEVYSPSSWWLAIFAVPAVVFLVLGLVLARKKHVLARILGGVVLLVFLAYTIAIPATIMNSRLELTPEGFTMRTGFWWRPLIQSVRFDALESIRVAPELKDQGPPTFVLECRRHDGAIIKIHQSDNLKAALSRIMINAARRGVKLQTIDPPEGEGPANP